ncbi:MAG: proton-conducting transporter membrane subunit [Rubrivivax sp.]|nr:proton-conducting transporter membrane subunit [Rubrivivax sp.]
MSADFLYGLLPDQLLLALVVVLMVMETARLDTRWARPVFIVGVGAALAVLLQQIGAGYSAEIIAGEVRIDRFALLAKAVVLACGLAVAAGFAAGFAGRGAFKFWLLLAAMLLGAGVVMGSAGFATLFIGIELLSLPAFALMVQGQGRTVASEGAFKYLLMSSIGTALLLFGISLAYGSTGSLGIGAFVQALGTASGTVDSTGDAQLQAAALLVLCGLFLKAAVFPFHAWAPDAYASTRIEVMAILASVVKAAVVLTLVRIFGGEQLGSVTIALVAPLAIVSIVFGNLAALGQRRFKRLLAYSSVAHAGYMVFALVDGTGSRPADLLWYTAFYALATLLASACYARLCPGRDDGDGDGLEALNGQFHRHPLAALGLAFALLSLAGLPPFPGFFAKLFVFTSVIASGHLVAAVLAFVGSFLGLAVYLGIVLRLFRAESPTAADGRSAPQPLSGA